MHSEGGQQRVGMVKLPYTVNMKHTSVKHVIRRSLMVSIALECSRSSSVAVLYRQTCLYVFRPTFVYSG